MNLLSKTLIIIQAVLISSYSIQGQTDISKLIPSDYNPGISGYHIENSKYRTWLENNGISENDLIQNHLLSDTGWIEFQYASLVPNLEWFSQRIYKWQEENSVFIAHDIIVHFYIELAIAEIDWLLLQEMDYVEIKQISEVVLIKYLDELFDQNNAYSMNELWMKELGSSSIESPYKHRNKYGKLKVNAIPQNSEVHIDEKFVDYSESEFILTEGEHEITVMHSYYKRYTDHIKIERGKRILLNCILEKK